MAKSAYLPRLSVFSVFTILSAIGFILCSPDVCGQDTVMIRQPIDLIDIGRHLFLKHPGNRVDSAGKKAGKVYGSLLPSAEYTLQTPFAVNLTANAAFYTGEAATNKNSKILLKLTSQQK